jgi:hypothetical protein
MLQALHRLRQMPSNNLNFSKVVDRLFGGSILPIQKIDHNNIMPLSIAMASSDLCSIL